MATLVGSAFVDSAFGSLADVVDVGSESEATSTTPRSSMYVDLFEEMLDAILIHEQFLLSPAEILFFQKYRELSTHARYLLIRLTLRKSGAWFRQCKLEAQYSSDLGPHTLVAMQELTKCEVVCSDAGAGAKTRSIRFAIGDDDATTEDLLNCLQREELKILAKRNHTGHSSMNMKALRESLLSHTSSQTVLPFSSKSTLESKQLSLDDAFRRSSVPASFLKTVKSENLRAQVLLATTPCIQIGNFARCIFSRLNLIYLRSTTIVEAEALLLPCILNRAHRRSYPTYSYCRTATIFRTREDLLAYEEALRIEASIDAAMATRPDRDNVLKGRILESPRRTRARLVRNIWEKTWDKWATLVANCDHTDKPTGFERFECGYVLTRVIYKGAEALAQLGEHELEVQVLKALLAQTRWRRTKRGAWWERLALVYMSHLDGEEEANRRQALRTVIEGLDDPFTHAKYRPTLERRMKRLEGLLKIDRSVRRKCQYKQKKHQTRTIAGERVWEEPEDLKVDKRARCVLRDTANLIATPTTEGDFKPSESSQLCDQTWRSPEVVLAWRRGKSVWKGRQREEVTVEGLALQHYERMGFKGIHSEGSIIGCLFSLLFWDVLFAPIPGAFETPYQTAPLDLWEDSFYYIREDLIKTRIQELEDGYAANILKEVDDRERRKNTWCVGVKWNLLSQEDLLKVVECIGSAPLASLCSILAEDYSLGTAGVPDLFVWDPSKKSCMFVEVKGPGDTLQENQKVWIDLLIKAGFVVELCKVVEEDDLPPVEDSGKRKGEDGKETKVKKKRRKHTGDDPSGVEVICLISDEEGELTCGLPTTSGGTVRSDSVPAPVAVRDGTGDSEVFVYQLSPPRKRKRKSV